jgi:hypothetical protein
VDNERTVGTIGIVEQGYDDSQWIWTCHRLIVLGLGSGTTSMSLVSKSDTNLLLVFISMVWRIEDQHGAERFPTLSPAVSRADC